MNPEETETHLEVIRDDLCLFSCTGADSPHSPCLILRYSLGLTQVNQPLTPQTPASKPPVVQLISLYTGLCRGKMPWGHVSLNSFILPPLAQCTSPHPPPPPPPSSPSPVRQHHIISFLRRLPDFTRPLLPAGPISRPQPSQPQLVLVLRVQRLALTSGNAPCRVTAYQADPFHTEESITSPV